MLSKVRGVVVLSVCGALLSAGCSDDGATTASPADAADAGADVASADDAQLSDVTGGDAAGGDAALGDTGSDVDAGAPACALAEPFDTRATYSSELYVSPDGDDSHDGSQAQPFATLAHAANVAQPGSRIHLMAGTHAAGTYIGGLAGHPDAPIAIVAEPGAVIDGGNTGLQLSEPRFVVLENLTIQNAAQNGLNIDDGGSFDTPAHHVVMRGITVRDIGDGGNQDCIKLSGLDNFWLVDSDVSACTGQGIDMVGCHDGYIRHNRIHDKTGAGIQAKGGTADVVIHANRFSDVAGRGVNAGGSTGLQYFRPQDAPFEGARIGVFANIFERVGAGSGAPIAYVGCDACVFANNTVIEPKTWVARILQETTGERFVPSRDGLFVNNIVVFEMADLRNGVFVNVGANTAPETFTFANNLWYALDKPDFAGPTLTNGIPAAQASIIQEAPGFADRDGGDYHLDATSPAAAAGQPLDQAGYPDHDDRCYDNPPTVGAYAPKP